MENQKDKTVCCPFNLSKSLFLVDINPSLVAVSAFTVAVVASAVAAAISATAFAVTSASAAQLIDKVLDFLVCSFS